jgi:nucleolar pre-ribosomal-associated protein 1
MLGASIDSIASTHVLNVLRTVLSALRRSTATESASESALHGRLQQLLVLRRSLTDSILEDMIAIALDASLPLCHEGHPFLLEDTRDHDLASIIRRSDARWYRRSDRPAVELDLQSFIAHDSWTKSTAKILSAQLYRRSYPGEVFSRWLGTDYLSRCSTHNFALVMHAFLDSSYVHGEEISDADGKAWILHFSHLLTVVVNNRHSQELRLVSGSCISLIFALVPSKLVQNLALFLTEVQSRPIESLTAEVLAVGNRLHAKAPTDARNLVNTLVDHGLKWAVQCFAGDHDQADYVTTVEELSTFLQLELCCS